MSDTSAGSPAAEPVGPPLGPAPTDRPRGGHRSSGGRHVVPERAAEQTRRRSGPRRRRRLSRATPRPPRVRTSAPPPSPGRGRARRRRLRRRPRPSPTRTTRLARPGPVAAADNPASGDPASGAEVILGAAVAAEATGGTEGTPRGAVRGRRARGRRVRSGRRPRTPRQPGGARRRPIDPASATPAPPALARPRWPRCRWRRSLPRPPEAAKAASPPKAGGVRPGGAVTRPDRHRGGDDGDAKSAGGRSRRRSGRERRGRPVGRYLMCVHVRPHATQIAVLEGRTLVEH